MKVISFNGYEGLCSYVKFTIEGGKSYYSCGDTFWCSDSELEISDMVTEDELNGWLRENEIAGKTKQVIKGSLRRLGII
ncbi:hypothetical protein NVP1121O_220 [Vibrio phage 1.121.O._10N.286.46.C4]|nr:hypothetical protein NVP1121O_220 [Vibrio phage 1.121.O._10N.286.46.C4]